MKISLETQNKVLELYKNGLFTLQIAKNLNIGRSSVGRILRKNNIKIKSKSEVGKIKRKQFLDKDSEIVNIYKGGLTCEEIGKIFNTSARYIQEVLYRNNITLRTVETWTRKYSLNENYFKKIDTHNKAMILGFLYADGNVINQTTRIKISQKDRDFLESIRKEIKSENRISITTDKASRVDYLLLALNSKIMAQDLRNIGCVDNKTFKIRFPKWLDKKFWPSFIAGYYFGDGSSVWTKSTKHYKNSSKSYPKCTFEICSNTKFILDLADIFKTIELHCSIRINKNPKVATLSIGGHLKVLKVMKWLYQNKFIRMERKFKMFKELSELHKDKYNKYLNEISF